MKNFVLGITMVFLATFSQNVTAEISTAPVAVDTSVTQNSEMGFENGNIANLINANAGVNSGIATLITVEENPAIPFFTLIASALGIETGLIGAGVGLVAGGAIIYSFKRGAAPSLEIILGKIAAGHKLSLNSKPPNFKTEGLVRMVIIGATFAAYHYFEPREGESQDMPSSDSASEFIKQMKAFDSKVYITKNGPENEPSKWFGFESRPSEEGFSFTSLETQKVFSWSGIGSLVEVGIKTEPHTTKELFGWKNGFSSKEGEEGEEEKDGFFDVPTLEDVLRKASQGDPLDLFEKELLIGAGALGHEGALVYLQDAKGQSDLIRHILQNLILETKFMLYNKRCLTNQDLKEVMSIRLLALETWDAVWEYNPQGGTGILTKVLALVGEMEAEKNRYYRVWKGCKNATKN